MNQKTISIDKKEIYANGSDHNGLTKVQLQDLPEIVEIEAQKYPEEPLPLASPGESTPQPEGRLRHLFW